MKRLIKFIICSLLVVAVTAFAKGSFSSGGGGVGRSFSSAPRVTSSPNISTSPRVAAPAPRTATRSVTTTTTSSTVRSRYVSGGGIGYGGFGMGYHYSNGLLTGMLIGGMLHPHGVVMYTGPGAYYNNALLYPNGQVVLQSGQLVGTYVNGVFYPIANGAIVAKPVPTEEVATASPQPVVIQQENPIALLLWTVTIISFFILVVILL